MPVDGQNTPVGQQDEPVAVPVAARRLGKSPDAIRSAIRRGRLHARKGNDGEWRVWLPVVDDRQRQSPDRAEPETVLSSNRQATVDELRERVRQLEAVAEHTSTLLLKATERAARAEGEAVVLRDALADLARRLDLATAELARARQPWWLRFFR